MGLFRLLQPGGAEAAAGGGSHAAAPQVRRPLPAPGQAAQDGGGGPGPDQCQGQSVPGCRGQGDDHQRQLCESGAGYRDLEVVFTGVSSQEGFCGDYPQFSEPASPSPFPTSLGKDSEPASCLRLPRLLQKSFNLQFYACGSLLMGGHQDYLQDDAIYSEHLRESWNLC